MITSIDFCHSQLQKIEDLLLDEEQVLPLRYYKQKNEFRYEDAAYKRMYKLHYVDFQLEVVQAAGEVFISHDTMMNYHKYHALRLKTSDDILMKQLTDTGDLHLRELVSSLIHEKISNLFYDFDKTLKRARKSHAFAGLPDDATIIRNVLNLYQNVKKNKELQISHFVGIKLHYAISDILTDIYITFLSDRLAMMELKDVDAQQSMATTGDGAKLKWNGQQKHLVELYLQLKENGWLGDNELSKKSVANLLCQFFDLSGTKKKPDSNTVESVYQLLKGEVDKNEQYTVKYFYDQPKYNRQFDNLKPLRK